MGKRGHLLSPGNVVGYSVLCIAKCSVDVVDELFMHYFHNLSSAFGGFAPRPPPGLHPWGLSSPDL